MKRLNRRYVRPLVLFGVLAIWTIGCGGVEPTEVPPGPTPSAAVVSAGGVVRGAKVEMVVQVGLPFSPRPTQNGRVSIEPLGPVNQ